MDKQLDQYMGQWKEGSKERYTEGWMDDEQKDGGRKGDEEMNSSIQISEEETSSKGREWNELREKSIFLSGLSYKSEFPNQAP